MPDHLPSDDHLYAALLARDPGYEGRAYVGVTSTGIFCRLTCPARKPKRVNTVFFATPSAAVAAGFRACRRCRPLAEPGTEPPVVAALLGRLDAGQRWSERDLVASGLDPSTVRRVFRRRFGATFLDLARRDRISRGLDVIASGGRVIDGQLDAGFDSASGFRAAVTRVIGQPPARLRPVGTTQGRDVMASADPGPVITPRRTLSMTPDPEKARRFAALHVKGDPLILYNSWDAGSARAIAEGGARAVATGSWSVAAAQGYPDGEAIPLDLLERIVGRIVASIDLPVTIDLEGGYAVEPLAVADNVRRILAAGAVGINIEDGIVGAGSPALHPAGAQGARLRAVRVMAEANGTPCFINARTDLFLQAAPVDHGALLHAALERAAVYADAGANGFFVPGLADEGSIARLCAAASLPVNVMMLDGMPPPRRLAALGVARISYGPTPYRLAMADLTRQARAVAIR